MTNFKKTILLTGAGFTANFGGPLAREMWSKIFNSKKLEKVPAIKKLLSNNFDFEAIYADVVRSSTFTDEEKAIFQEVILGAYEDMDKTIKLYCNNGFRNQGVHWGGVSSFLGLFTGTGSEIGAHFTLNQDLLLERSVTRIPLGLTALKNRDYWDSIFARQLDPNKPVTLPNQAELNGFINTQLSSQGQPYYIKLHGSYGWLSYTGSNQMVIGKNKAEDIEKEPMLKWYFELFKEAIYRKDVNLIVIGYGFGDQHINDCILNAVNEYGLNITIISPEEPENLKNRLEGRSKDTGTIWEVSKNYKIWEAVTGYFQNKMKDIFPEDETQTPVAEQIKEIIK